MATTENRFLAYLADYASYHRTKGNKITHYFGIPLLTVTIAGLLSKLQFGPSFAGGLAAWDVAFVLWIAVSVWYIRLDLKIGTISSLIGLGLYMLGRPLPLWVLMICFVVGWAIQYVGHLWYEHNKPAFYKNFEHLLIGPVWVFGQWFRFIPPLPEAKGPIR